MKVVLEKEPFPIQKCLVLNAMILKARFSINDYAYFLMVSDLEPHENYQIPADARDEVNDWLRQFGDMSFRDLQHLQRIADLIEREYLAKKGEGPRLDPIGKHDLAGWLAKCNANRLF